MGFDREDVRAENNRTNDTITCVPSLLVGHAQDPEALTGCTVLLCPDGGVAGMAILGSAAGTRQTDSLADGHLVEKIHGICLTGGSSFGLAACDGVMAELAEKGIGFPVGDHLIPVVPGAVIFDLRIGDGSVRPDAAMGRAAVRNASASPVSQGCVGVGTGATVGKLLGIDSACKSGLGSAGIMTEDGLAVGALAVVNAFGDVQDPETHRLLAGARKDSQSRSLASTDSLIRMGKKPLSSSERAVESTTLGVVATNALLSKAQARKVAQMAGYALGSCLSPPSTLVDGDIVFCISLDGISAEIHRVSLLARELLEVAILRAVLRAEAAAGLLASRDLDLSGPGR